MEDTWESIRATIDYSLELGSTVAQFKVLTPYPGTPLFKRMAPLIDEMDWEEFDGFTPTFRHPHLSGPELRFLLGSAYTRFYVRPSFVANYLRITAPKVRRVVARLDTHVERRHGRKETAMLERALSW